MATTLAESPDVAFERMYEEYARTVYRYALALMRNPADAEDITQTTFLNAYRAMKGGERPLMPRHWLLKIAHNTCRMRWVRNSRRPQEVEFDDKVERIAAPESERPSIRAVLDELAKLPFNQRSALVMRELEGRSYEEIAETLDVTVPAVETLLVRARRSLRLRKSAINVLGAVQLPASLETFFGSGAAVATGGALVGGVAFKAAALLVAGLVAGGAGYTAVGATKKPRPDRSEPLAAAAAVHVQRGSVRTLRVAATKPQRAVHASAPNPAQPAAAAPTKQHDPASPQTPPGTDAAPAAPPADSPPGASPSKPGASDGTGTAAAPATTTTAALPVQPPQLPVQPPPAPLPVPLPAPAPLPAPLPPTPVQPPTPPPVPTVPALPLDPHLP